MSSRQHLDTASVRSPSIVLQSRKYMHIGLRWTFVNSQNQKYSGITRSPVKFTTLQSQKNYQIMFQIILFLMHGMFHIKNM